MKECVNLIGGCEKTLNKTVLTDVFEKTVPLSLHNVKLFKEKTINFLLVGGLKEAKQSITETIIWPSLVSLNCYLLFKSCSNFVYLLYFSILMYLASVRSNFSQEFYYMVHRVQAKHCWQERLLEKVT